MMTVVITKATAADLPAVRALLQAHDLPLAGVDDCVDAMLVARDGARIVGAAALELYAGSALLRSVVVDRAAQGAGVGSRLTQAALELARERDADAVFLLTTTADRFFPRFGFERVTREDVPASVRGSVEFVSACPASAVAMRTRLSRR
jgi:amino-acid N-acetyltransferase